MELYEDFFDSVSDVILFVDATGKVIDINKAGVYLMGYDKAELLGMNLYKDLLVSADISKMEEIIERLKQGEQQSYTIRWRTRAGGVVLFDGASTARFDTEGNFLTTRCILREGYLNQVTKTKLEKSQALLKKAQEIGKIGHWELNFETNELIWSDQIYEMFGIDSNTFDANYTTFLETIHPDDRQMVDDAYAFSVENKTGYDIDHRIILKTGEQKWVNEKGETLYDKEGNSIRSIGTVQDITSKKQTEAALREKDFILNSASTSIGTTSLDGRLTYVNPAFLEKWGFEEEEVIGRPFTDFWMVSEELDSIMEALLGDVAAWKGEIQGRKKDGSLFDIYVSSATVFNNEGIPVALMLSSVDITERKETEKKLEKSQALLKKAQEIGAIGHWELDFETSELVCSEQIYQMFSIDSAQFEANYADFFEITHPDDRDLVNEAYSSFMQNRKPYDMDHRILLKNGELKWVNEKSEIIYDENGNAIRAIGTVQDITEQEQSRKELRANEELFRSLAENSQAHIMLLNSEYEIQYLNHTVAGLSLDQFIGVSILDFVPKEDQLITKEIFDNCFLTGKSTQHERAFSMPNIKTLYHFEIHVSPIFEGEEVVQLLIASTNITERKKAEQKLEKSLGHLHLAMDAAKMGTFEWNVKEDESFWSEEVLHLFGTTSEKFKGNFEAYLEFIPEESREGIRTFILNFIKTAHDSDIIHYEHEIRTADGKTTWIEVRAKMFTDNKGRAIRFSGLGIDITERKQAEQLLLDSQEKLKESEERFRAVSEQASEAITIADLEGNYTFVNHAFSEMMGYSEEELLTMTVFDMKRDPLETNVFKAAKNGAVVAEIDLKRKDGSIFLSKVSGKPIFVGENEFILGIITDIEEERATEMQLKESRQQFEDLFDSSPDPIFLHNYTIITNVNQAFLKEFGYESKKDVIGKPPVETIVFTEDIELMWKVREELKKEGTAYIPCIRLLKSDGSHFISESRVSTVVANGEVHLQITNRDITERKEFERKLMKSEATLQAIQDHSPALISIKDKTGVLLMANKQFEVLKGFKREEFVGKSIYDVFSKDIADELWANDLKAFEMDAPIAVEEIVEHNDGTLHTYLSVKFPIYIDSNEPLGVCAISTDITQQKNALEKIKSNETKVVNLYQQLQDINQVVRAIDDFSRNKIGDDYFRSIVIGLSDMLKADYTFIAGVSKDLKTSTTQFLSIKGEIVDNMSYALKDTPCTEVVKGQVCYHAKDIQELFPKDLMLVEMEAEAYVGVPVFTRNGEEGEGCILVALFTNPINNRDFYEHILRVFAQKIQSELERNNLLQIVKEGELKYKGLFDNISDGMGILDKKGNVLHHNPAFSKILGYDDDDWKTISIAEIIHPDHRNVFNEQYLKLKKEGVYDGYETRVVRKDESVIWIQVNSTAIFDEDGKFIGSNDVIRNITERKKAEFELSKAQEMLKETSRVAQIGGWEVDLVEQKMVWSEITKQIYEVPVDYEPNLETAINFYEEGECRDFIVSVYDKAINKGESYDVQVELITAKNNKIWTRAIGFPEFRDGKCVRIFGTVQDITEQKRLEAKLEKANEAEFAKLYRQQKDYSDQIEIKSKELNRFFELSSDMICIVNAEGIIQRLNPSLANTLGYTEEEMLYQPMHKFLNSEDKDKTITAIAEAQENDGLIAVVNRYQTKDGDFRWFSWHAIEDPTSGLRYAVARDITEEKKANREIEDLKNTLDQIAMIIIIDKNRNIVSVNDKFCEASGYSRDDVIGGPYNILRSNYHSKEYWLKLRRTVSIGKIWRGEMKTEKKDGSFFWADTYIVPFYDEMGKIFQFIVIQSDITGRKKLEKDLRQAEETALKSAEIKENFLANMSHEIRTPMNAILGFSRLLLLTQMGDKQHDYAQAIYGSAENLLVIINDILDFSKIESGKFRVESINYDLTQTINDVLNVLKAPIQDKKLELILDISPDIPQYLIGAPNRIAQVLINLVGNAVKFTHKGYVKIIVTKKNNHWLLFEVKDTGIGIPTEKLESIFDSFTQAENNTTRMYGGTGLGLSISKKIVSLMGGSIHVESEVGMGSTFSFQLPLKVADSSSPKVLKVDKQVTEISIAGANILVVEDNRLNQELMIIYLKMLKCHCDLAENGQEAVDMVLKKDYDLIFMDIQMPIMDGLEATKLIREQTEETPIIAMTAHALKKEKQKCFDIGMNDYLGKPFRKEELEEMIVKHISEHVQLIEQPSSNKKEEKSKETKLELSIQQLSHEVAGNEEMVKQVLLLFKEEVNEFNEMLQKAIAKQDLKQVAQIVHKVKPNFELLQLNYLVEIILEIEKLVAENKGPKRVYKHCHELLAYIPMVQLQIAEELV